jgi:putative endonuclease
VAAKDGLGRYGERVAERVLLDAGMTVLARNWRCDEGEIDLVARDGDALVVCEVKTRSSDAFGQPSEAVGAAKSSRLRRLALRWLAESGAHPPEIRFDVVSVLADGRGAAKAEHLRGVL